MSKMFKFMAKAGLITALVVVLLLIGVGLVFADDGVKIGGNGYQCVTAENRWKVENGGYADLPDGYIIESVVVKAGQGCIDVYPTNTAPTCYEVSVVDNTVLVEHIGDGPECKEISHLEGTYQEICTPDPGYHSESDCEGWQIIKVDEDGSETVVDEGKWKDLTTDESFYWGRDYVVHVVEPQNCTQTECIPEYVFYWFSNINPCSIRQRGGPIGGQTRPFLPMQTRYCGCGYEPHDDWGYRLVNSCTNAVEYTYWDGLPLYNGARACE